MLHRIFILVSLISISIISSALTTNHGINTKIKKLFELNQHLFPLSDGAKYCNMSISHLDISPECIQDIDILFGGLKRNKLWAYECMYN